MPMAVYKMISRQILFSFLFFIENVQFKYKKYYLLTTI